jgi:uncharacterized protein
MGKYASALLVILALLVPTSALAVSIQDVPNPRADGKWVTDMIDMVDQSTEDRLNALIDAAEKDLSVEIAVVCVDDVDTATPKEFATDLFNAWGIGKADVNNGLLVLMVRDRRRLEMETGYGMESVLTDGWLKSMQEAEMVPRFKKGNFGEGLLVGVRVSIERIRAQKDGIVSDGTGQGQSSGQVGTSNQTYTPSLRSRFSSVPSWVWALLGFFGFGSGGVAFKRRRERMCPTCKKKMTMLPEDWDDEHLHEGQKTEERIGSVDWQYWYCEICGFSKLLRVGKWFSGYSNCRSCHNKTMSTTQTTITAATTSSSGTARVTEDCKHCSHHRTWTKTLPRIQQSSSSSSSSSYSSSSSSSFGGGSSGGGGSGSSW